MFELERKKEGNTKFKFFEKTVILHLKVLFLPLRKKQKYKKKQK